MTSIKVTVKNTFLNGVEEIFDCRGLDIEDFEEVQYCIDECCGIFLERHMDHILKTHPNLSEETIAQECNYIMEVAAI